MRINRLSSTENPSHGIWSATVSRGIPQVRRPAGRSRRARVETAAPTMSGRRPNQEGRTP